MTFTLIKNWRTVLAKAHSIRFTALATLFSVGQGAIEFYASGQPPWMVGLITLVSLGSAVARIVDQSSLSGSENAP